MATALNRLRRRLTKSGSRPAGTTLQATAPGTATRCSELIDTLLVPRPFDTDLFLTALSRQRGKEIKLVAGLSGVDQPCGMLISTPGTDYIYYAEDMPPLQARHTVMHEVGHLLLDHCLPRSGAARDTLGDDALRLMVPTLSPELVRRILGRTVYDSAQEREAELFASLMLSRVDGTRDIRRVRQATQRLTPLWRRIVAEVPQVRLHVDEGPLSPAQRAQYRLYRRALEIRDAQLVLRPFIPPQIPEWTFAVVGERGLDPATADILLEAAELGAALDAHHARRRHHAGVVKIVLPRHHVAAPDLLAEARRLIQVATALHCDAEVSALRRRAEDAAARPPTGGPRCDR